LVFVYFTTPSPEHDQGRRNKKGVLKTLVRIFSENVRGHNPKNLKVDGVDLFVSIRRALVTRGGH
jgi:hypothetical protein